MPADPRTIAEEALRLAEGATPGPYIWARTKQDTRQGCIDWYAENYDHGVEGPIHAVVVPDGDAPIEELCKTVAITGNGPTSEANALLLTHAGTHYGTLARAYLEMLPPESAWSHDEGDVVLTHPDGSTERFYAGERAPYVAAACSRYEALVSDLPVVIEAAERDAQLAEDEAFYERDEPGGDEKEAALLSERAKAIRAACERLRALGGGTP